MIRVLLVDDHAIVRAGLRALFSCETDLEVVGEASDGQEGYAAAQRLGPDVVLLDLTMPRSGGIDAIARFRAGLPRARVLVLSMHATAEHVRGALRGGAHGYVVKGEGLETLVDAVRAVAAGETYVDPRVAGVAEAADEAAPIDDLERLTPREREVLQLVAEGSTNREIGARLGLSPKTVDAHRTNLMRKLDLHDAQAVTRFAIRKGLVSAD